MMMMMMMMSVNEANDDGRQVHLKAKTCIIQLDKTEG